MNASFGTGLSREHRRELSRLVGSRRKRFAKYGLFAALFVVSTLAAFNVYLARTGSGHSEGLEDASSLGVTPSRRAPKPASLRPYVSRDAVLRDWLDRRGIALEQAIYDVASDALHRNAAALVRDYGADEVSGTVRAYLAFHFGLLNVVFVFLAVWRLWLAAVLVAVIGRVLAFGPYAGADVLGVLGNGRLYFSGVRVGLEKRAPSGAPDVHVPTLLCLPRAGDEETSSSRHAEVLRHYGAENRTNLELVSFLLAARDRPAYAPPAGEDPSVAARFERVSLPDNAALVLENALFLHARYRGGLVSDASFSEGDNRAGAGGGVVTGAAHAAGVLNALHRVLTVRMREEVGALAPAEVAAVVLAYEAGKILALSGDGGTWIRKSNYPELTARAVLHAAPSLAADFDHARRQVLRRSLIYASRTSTHAPNCFPLDLEPAAAAARQWTEVLSALPHSLHAVADEVELAGACQEAHRRWSEEVTERVLRGSGRFTEDAFVGPSDVLYVPAADVLSVLRECVGRKELTRMEELVAVVSRRDRLRHLAPEAAGEGEGRETPVVGSQHVLSPLPHAEMCLLAERHGLSFDDVRDWSTLRAVLHGYGWLARRVGARTVPETSIIFAAYAEEERPSGRRAEQKKGSRGVVPLRGGRIEAEGKRIGRSWTSRVKRVFRVALGETPDEFERLLRGGDAAPVPAASIGEAEAEGASGPGGRGDRVTG